MVAQKSSGATCWPDRSSEAGNDGALHLLSLPAAGGTCFFGNKYENIAMHENLLFGYQEFHAVIEVTVIPGRLGTKGPPVPWENSRMDLHFQPWDDGYLYFKPIEPIYAYSIS